MGRRLDAITFGPGRRSRRMMRQLKQLDRHDAKLRAVGRDPLEEWHRTRDPRPATTLPVRTSASRQRGPAVLAVILAAAITALIVWHDHTRSSPGAGSTRHGRRPCHPPGSGNTKIESVTRHPHRQARVAICSSAPNPMAQRR